MTMNVSFFQNFNEVSENRALPAVLELIQNGRFKSQIETLRLLLDKGNQLEFDRYKKSLPAFTPSATFKGGRKADLVDIYSGFVHLDFDKLSSPQLQITFDSIINIPYTYACFRSPSGNGLKVFIKVDTGAENHLQAYQQVQAFYENELKIPCDGKCKDITRLCFISYDVDSFINEASQIFKVVTSNKSFASKDVTPTDYKSLFDDSVTFTRQYTDFVSGNRNTFVHQLACNLNRKGIPFHAALGFILNDFNYDEQEVKGSVQSAYKNTSEFGISKFDSVSHLSPKEKVVDEKNEKKASTNDEDEKPKKRIPAIDKVENFLLSKYRFRHNVITGRLEYRHINKKVWQLMKDFDENSLLRELLKNKIKTNMSSLRNLLYSDFCELFNPFTTYFESLHKWDEQTDYIALLADTISTTHQELWHICFRKWLIAMVGCVLDEHTINQTVIVFSGKQGVGKTTWMENLIPKELKQYLFSGTINPNNKDTLIHLSECMLINLDELENLNRTEIGSLKELITKTHIRVRRAYGHNNETLPRCASFAGSVNTSQFLNDTTGSRRFLSFEVNEIKYDHVISLEAVYAQALYLFRSGFRFWFNRDEIAAVNQNNEQYQLRSPEEELLTTWFEACTKENANTFLTASQILVKLAEKAKINVSDSSVNKLGKALIKNKFLRFKSNGKLIYALRELQWEEVDSRNRIVIEYPSQGNGDPNSEPVVHRVDFRNDLPF